MGLHGVQPPHPLTPPPPPKKKNKDCIKCKGRYKICKI